MELLAIKHVVYPAVYAFCPFHETLVTGGGGEGIGGEYVPEEVCSYLLFRIRKTEAAVGITGIVEKVTISYIVRELYEEAACGYIEYAPMSRPALEGAFPVLAECL